MLECIVNFSGGEGVLKCGETVQSTTGCHLASVPNRSQVDVSEKLRPVDSLGGLDSPEICVPSHTGLGGGGLVLSHEAREMVVNAA